MHDIAHVIGLLISSWVVSLFGNLYVIYIVHMGASRKSIVLGLYLILFYLVILAMQVSAVFIKMKG